MRILVVDDDELLGRAAARCLRAHQVTVTGSFEAAKSVLQADLFDLIISDVTMPGGSGPDLHRWVVEHYPDLARRFVFATGGMAADDQAYILSTGLKIILKPQDYPELLEIIRAMGP